MTNPAQRQYQEQNNIGRKILLQKLCHNKYHISNCHDIKIVFYILKIIIVSTITEISNQVNHTLNVILLINNKKFQ